MKKSIKILLATGLLLCTAGALLIGIGVINGGREGLSTRLESNHIYTQEKTPLEGPVDSLRATLIFSDLRILPSSDDHYYIAYQLDSISATNPLSYTVENNVLTLTEADIDAPFEKRDALDWLARVSDDDFDLEAGANRLTLYVPENALKDIHCQMGYGNLFLEQCKPQSLTAHLTYGDVSLDGTAWCAASIGLEYGDLEANAIACDGPTQISVEYGDVDFQSSQIPDATSIQIDADYGEISVDPRFGGLLNGDDMVGTRYERPGTPDGHVLTIKAEYGDITLQ